MFRNEVYSPHELPLEQSVWTTRMSSFGGAREPTYCQFTAVPSSKSHAYANHSVGAMSAGSEIAKPRNSRPCASVRKALSKPPIAVGGTFAIVTSPSPVPRPSMTTPSMPLMRMLSTAHHQSSALSYRNRTTTLEEPPTAPVSAVSYPWNLPGLLW